jgi:hypothetical protein
MMLAEPPLFARQFSHLVEATQSIARPMASFAALTFAWLAYISRGDSLSRELSWTATAERGFVQWHLFAIAFGVCLATTPFTAAIILPINGRMKQLAQKVKQETGKPGTLSTDESQEVKRLVATWAKWNKIRCIFPLTGSVIALWASLKSSK